MVIDLPSNSLTTPRGSQNPVTQLTNQRQETLQAALKALNIKAGETITALVKSIRPVDDPLRVRLVQQVTPPSESADSNGVRNATAQEKLLASSDLKLVEVEIKGKPLLIYTDKALRPNQTLTLQQQNGVLIQIPGNPAPSATSPTSQANLANDARPSVLTSQQLATLQQALRTELPHLALTQKSQAGVISETLLIAQLITRLLKQPGHQSLQHQLPRSLQESLQQLASHLRDPQQLSRTEVLKQAIKGSGIQLEQQLSQHAGNNPSYGQPPFAKTDLKAALLHSLKQITQYNQSQTIQSQNTPSPSGAATLQPTLPGSPQPAAVSSLAGSYGALNTNPNATATTAQGLIAFLQQLLPVQPQRAQGLVPSSPRNLDAGQLMQITQAQIQQALGKILCLQLQSLQRSHSGTESSRTSHAYLEIPISLGFTAQPLALIIEEEWVTDYSEDNDSPKEKVRQWLVKLAFDLPEAGAFHAHVTVITDKVTVSLWAENPATYQSAQATLGTLRKQLEQEGCQVKNLECFQGKPANDNSTRLNYALVDVKT
ncbi:flagellar hook-length control protein FliK [Aestuariicella sp. G3-2]|uniref:flagellar hook-length control protein FliK n=1 Tax=Pseudomaricurvus albidus TaxID=2842452 RepID=UPI001C0B2337|nr:flagellar hook-length control protein FliK [Aestuariicella albida]MBU3069960.1 flagellar hook-length control protein FliK [Aestuariicella albida]